MSFVWTLHILHFFFFWTRALSGLRTICNVFFKHNSFKAYVFFNVIMLCVKRTTGSVKIKQNKSIKCFITFLIWPCRSTSRSRSDRRYKSSRYSQSHSGSPGDRQSLSHSPMSSRRRHMGTRDNPKPSRCLGVFGLSVYTTEDELYHIFSKYGPLERVQVVIDAKVSQLKQFKSKACDIWEVLFFNIIILDARRKRKCNVPCWHRISLMLSPVYITTIFS